MRGAAAVLPALRLLCVPILLCAAGCAVGPDFVRPAGPAVGTYARGSDPSVTMAADGQAQRFEEGAGVAPDWWRLFKSPEMDAVISEALENNPTLEAAQASLRRSQELLRAGMGVFYPQIDASLDVTRQKSSPSASGGRTQPGSPAASPSASPVDDIRHNSGDLRHNGSQAASQTGSGGGTGSSIFSLYTAAATVSYALDIFGGNRRTVEGLEAQVDLQRYQLMGAYLTLTGNVVNTVVSQAVTREQIRATEEIIGLQREQVGLAETQADAGVAPYSVVLNLRSQLAATEATLPPLRQRLSQAEHLLAALAGHTPAEWAPPEVALSGITLPADLPLSLPSELVHRRPDILAAEAQLHTASADIGVATAALYPSVTLSGSYGYNNSALGKLFRDSSSFWSLGAGLLAPIFHGGTLQAQKRAAEEGYRQTLADYRQTVLSAFAQVADTLRALEHDAEGLRAQERALETAEEALRLVRANFEAGIVDFSQLLITNSQYQQARIAYLQAKAQRLQDTTALFVALGGGWGEGEKGTAGRNAGEVRVSADQPRS